jgi:hypothetical protein
MRRLFAYGTWFILVHGLACWLVNQRIPLQTLSFRAARPADESDFECVFVKTFNTMRQSPSSVSIRNS